MSLNSFLISAEEDTPDNYITTFVIYAVDSAGRIWIDEFSIRIRHNVEHVDSSLIFSTEIRLDTDAPGNAASKYPQISSDENGNIYVAWKDDRHDPPMAIWPKYDIYFNCSTDYGYNWLSEDIRLNTDTPEEGNAESARISSDNNGNVYVVWTDGRNYFVPPDFYITDIYFNHSSDYGVTWEPQDIRLDTDMPGSHFSAAPQISCDNNENVYVVWEDSRDRILHPPSWGYDIYLNNSYDGGNTWLSEETRIDTNAPGAAASLEPQISSDSNGNIYVVWNDNRNGDDDIYFNHSYDYGMTWQQNDIRLETDVAGTAYSWSADISCDENGNVYVVWQDDRNGEYDIYFNHSFDYGMTWQQNDIRLETDVAGAAYSRFADISCDENGNVYVVWWDERSGDGDIYFNHSSDYGVTWELQDIRLDTDMPGATESRFPNISCDENGNVYVVWYEYRDGNAGIYFNYSTDYGQTWQSEDIRLDTAGGVTPQINSDNNGNVYVVWRRGGDIHFVSLIQTPMLSHIDESWTVEEGGILTFTIVATSYNGTPLEFLFNTQGLSQDLQNNMSTATIATSFNEGVTTGTFNWTPPPGSAGVYYPVIFVARDPETGRCAYQAITIRVRRRGGGRREITEPALP